MGGRKLGEELRSCVSHLSSEEPVYWHWRTAEDLFKVVIAEVAWKLV